MNAAAQAAVILGVSLAAAGATWWVKGPPDRTAAAVDCDPTKLPEDERCLAEIVEIGPENFLWVDARPRSQWRADGYPGSILWNLEPDEDMNAFAAEAAPRLLESPRVIVYCGDENCGISRQVAARIRELQMGNEVFVLHGGHRALAAAGLVTEPN